MYYLLPGIPHPIGSGIVNGEDCCVRRLEPVKKVRVYVAHWLRKL